MRTVRLQIVLALISATAVLAANPRPRPSDLGDAGRLVTRVINDRDGLPSNSIMSTLVDTRGYLWVGTQDGAAYSNGRVWTTVNMPNRTVSNYIRAMAASTDGSVWFGCDGGLHRLRDGDWTSYTIENGLPNPIVQALRVTTGADGAQELLIGTAEGMARLPISGGAVARESFPAIASASVQAFAESETVSGTRTLWVGTDRGLAVREGGAWRDVDVPFDAGQRSVNCLLGIDDASSGPALWVGTKAGLAVLQNGAWSSVTEAEGLKPGEVFALLESRATDGARTLWAATYNGLGRLRAGTWHLFTKASGLPSNLIGCLASIEVGDRTRTVWAGTRAGGLVSIETATCAAFDASTGAPDGAIWSLAESTAADGTPVYWAATYTSIGRLEKGMWTTIPTGPAGAAYAIHVRSTVSGQEILIGGRHGLFRLDGTRLTSVRSERKLPADVDDLLAATVFAFHETEDGSGIPTLWIGTRAGLVRKRGEEWSAFTTANGLPDDAVRSLCTVAGPNGTPTLWVGTDNAGIATFDGASWSVIDERNGLPNRSVHGLLATTRPDGRRQVWAGTWGGAAVFDADDPATARLVLSDEPSSSPILPNSVVYQVREDGRGQIYLCTNKGVARLVEREATADDPAPYSVTTFTVDDGMPSPECNSGASMTDRAGRVWVGTVAGITMFDPDRIVDRFAPSPLVIERATIGGNPRRVDGERLEHAENDPAFEFALLSYDRASRTTYRTQLAGYESSPTPWTSNFRREFTNLPAGDYVFRVWGRDDAGVVSGPVEMRFEIRPALWNTWWAHTLYLFGLLGVVLALGRLRESALRRRTAILEGKVARRTAEIARQSELLRVSEHEAHEANRAKSVFLANMSHELRTPLNAVLGFAQLLDRDRRLLPDQRARVDAIGRSGEHLLGLINDVLSISKIEAGSVTLNNLPFDVRDLVDGVVEMLRLRAATKGIRLDVEFAEGFPHVVVGDEGKVRQILLNLLNNAVKFTDHGAVTVHAMATGDTCRFEVRDTGRGISAGEFGTLFQPFVQTESGRATREGTGLGLAISRNYARQMGGDITVESEPGVGSVFACTIRLPEASADMAAAAGRRVVGIEGTERPRVLVADDTDASRTVLVELLRDVGFDVREASSGRQAEHLWSKWSPDAVLVAVRMPGVSGLDVTRRIRAAEAARNGEGQRTAIVALSAGVFEQDRKAIAEAGCDAFVPKPFRETTVFEELGRLLGTTYRHAPISEEGEAPGSASPGAATVTRLSDDVPRAMLDELRASVSAGDNQRALEVVDRMTAIDAAAARAIRALLLEYRFDEVLERIDDVR